MEECELILMVEDEKAKFSIHIKSKQPSDLKEWYRVDDEESNQKSRHTNGKNVDLLEHLRMKRANLKFGEQGRK